MTGWLILSHPPSVGTYAPPAAPDVDQGDVPKGRVRVDREEQVSGIQSEILRYAQNDSGRARARFFAALRMTGKGLWRACFFGLKGQNHFNKSARVLRVDCQSAAQLLNTFPHT